MQCVKKTKALYRLLGVLIVLMIAYFALQWWNRRQAEKDSEDAAVDGHDNDQEDIAWVS